MSMVHRKLKRGEGGGGEPPTPAGPRKGGRASAAPAAAPVSSAAPAEVAAPVVSSAPDAELEASRRKQQMLVDGIRGLQATVKALQERLRSTEHALDERGRELAETTRLAAERERILQGQINDLQKQLQAAVAAQRRPVIPNWSTPPVARARDVAGGGSPDSLLTQARRRS